MFMQKMMRKYYWILAGVKETDIIMRQLEMLVKVKGWFLAPHSALPAPGYPAGKSSRILWHIVVWNIQLQKIVRYGFDDPNFQILREMFMMNEEMFRDAVLVWPSIH